jgi:hypothetical protein
MQACVGWRRYLAGTVFMIAALDAAFPDLRVAGCFYGIWLSLAWIGGAVVIVDYFSTDGGRKLDQGCRLEGKSIHGWACEVNLCLAAAGLLILGVVQWSWEWT